MRSRPVAAALAAVVLAGLALLVLGATTGPGDVLRGPGPGALDRPSEQILPPQNEQQVEACEVYAESREERERCDPDSDPAWWRLFESLLSILLVCGAVLLGLHLLRLAWEHRPTRRPSPSATAVVDDTRDRLARAMTEAAEEQRAVLTEGSPRNAVVACWHRFEGVARRAGVPPERWETPSEFTARVLTDLGADPHALAWLAGLYREARFSEHELTESDRRSARAALEEITAGIRA